ncbi:MAG TPA: hypothetical protein VML58_01740 [Burkholderiaceae bacterium]|nr:hypothetical protein [Burkholderiaceae bacterium]
MSFASLSQAYRIAPSRRDAARAPAPLQAPGVNPDAPRHPGPDAGDDAGADREARGARGRDCDSASRSPLMRALLHALLPTAAADGGADLALEHALIAFARALNQASSDGDPVVRPAVVRANDAARRRADHEAALLGAFDALQQAAGRPRAHSTAALQAQLGAFLHELARQLDIDDDRAGEATQPGSLISVQA